ncbi:hypothetical protein QJS04_geneDACA016579 [Acorus gramineus]|uniref:Secreted protein n=1 Tax=Acorus gramineus TaxID=55184 RepID=A0AAV9BNY0_ACOGR|nr:hypothetical protein QJS04_geneDACA016579 [Acorus gramineus]
MCIAISRCQMACSIWCLAATAAAEGVVVAGGGCSGGDCFWGVGGDDLRRYPFWFD